MKVAQTEGGLEVAVIIPSVLWKESKPVRLNVLWEVRQS